MGLNWGAQWNYLQKGKWVLNVGAPEQKILTTIHDMIYTDKSVDPSGVGLSGSAVLPEFFAGKCAMTVQGNYQVPGHDRAEPEGLQLGDVPGAEGRHAEPGGRPADVLDRPAEPAQGRGDAVHRLRAERAEHGEALGRRLADPGLPGSSGDRREVDESLRQLAQRDRGGAGPREGELGLAQRLRALEGARSPPRRSAPTSRTN